MDRAIVSNLKRRPITMKEIKKNYNQIYNNTFGKARVQPLKKDFFKPKEDQSVFNI